MSMITLWKRRDDYWQEMSTAELRAEIQRRATNLQTWNGLPFEQAVRAILDGVPAAVSKRYGAQPVVPSAGRQSAESSDVPIQKEGSMIATVEDVQKRASELVAAGKAKDTTEALQHVFKADPFSYELYRAAHTPGQPVPVRPAPPEPPASPIKKDETVTACVQRLLEERVEKGQAARPLADVYYDIFREFPELHRQYRRENYA